MAISGIGFQENSLQVLRAQNAFQKTIKNIEESQKTGKLPQQEDVKVSISLKNINKEAVSDPHETMKRVQERKDPYISEIREFANKYNITDIEDQEIEEALKYGTSLLADYTA